VAVIGGYGAALLFVPANAGATARFVVALLLAVLLALAASLVLPIGEGSAERLFLNQSDSGRIEIWRQTVPVIGQSLLFGWGEAQFGTLLRSRFGQPHNIVLQILLAWGAVGFGLLAVLAALLANRVRRNANRQNAPLIFAICNIAAFSLIDGSLFHIHSVSVFALCAALLAADEGSARTDRRWTVARRQASGAT
jgi:O-antigen ligase